MSGSFPSGVGIALEIPRTRHKNLVSEAPSGVIQTRSKDGHRFEFDIETTPLEADTWKGLLGFFNLQRGMYDTFTYTSATYTTPMGTGNGTPLVNGADQTGRSVVTDGWDNSETVLKQGDIIKFNGHSKVYIVTADVTSDSSGNATISIEPSLRESPADDEALVITSVPFTVALATDLNEIETMLPLLGVAKFTLIERV